MVVQLYVACDGDWEEPEVQTSGSSKALAEFGALLNDIAEPITLVVPALESELYPVSVKKITIEPDQSRGDRITVTIDENNFALTGTKVALSKLADSLINFFDDDSSIGEHFQLDYYEGNEVLNETTSHLIFVCDR